MWMVYILGISIGEKGRIQFFFTCEGRDSSKYFSRSHEAVNLGEAIRDRKGITEKVELKTHGKLTKLSNGKVYNFPPDYIVANHKQYKQTNGKVNMPDYYWAEFMLDEIERISPTIQSIKYSICRNRLFGTLHTVRRLLQNIRTLL